jgi:methyl-accepting chemotaxis protein
VKIAGQTAHTLESIVNGINKVAQIVANIAVSSQQQSEAVSQVMIGLTQITQVVQNNTSTSEETASASQELSSQAELMQGLVNVFKLKK